MKHSTKLLLALAAIAALMTAGILIMHKSISRQMERINTNPGQPSVSLISVEKEDGKSTDSDTHKFKNPFEGLKLPQIGDLDKKGTNNSKTQQNGENEAPDASEGHGEETNTETPAAKDRIYTESGREVVHFVYCKDGDTIVVTRGDGEEITVRYIGVNTPESVAPEEYTEKTGKENNDFGKSASDHAKSIYKNTDILYLEYDTEQTDPYGRTLAYIYTNDTGNLSDMVNAMLLTDGYASTMKIEPNTRYAAQFESLQDDARGKRVGLWQYEEFYNNYQSY